MDNNKIEELLTRIMNLFASSFGKHAVLRGGMVLRLLDSPRLTNDLDYVFVPYKSKKDVVPQILAALKSLGNIEIKHSLNSKCLRCLVNRDNIVVQVEVKVDTACRTNALSTATLSKLHNQTPRLISVMAYDVAMANKMAAWYERRLVRDLYDIYLYINMGIKPDPAVLETRFKKVNFSKNIKAKIEKKSINIDEFYVFLREVVGKLSDQDIREELSAILPEMELLGLDMKIRNAVLSKL